MAPRNYTELFFQDEATALAAGFRPCFTCRRKRFEEFVSAWNKGNATGAVAPKGIKEIDVVLQAERLDDKERKVSYQASIDELPDGTFVLWPPETNTTPVLILGDRLLVWTPADYGHFSRSRPKDIAVTVITPRSIVNALSAGYKLLDLPEAPSLITVNDPTDYEWLARHPEITREDMVNRVFVLPVKNFRG